jgi:GNAT superfamily N-acetyltransferase
MNLEYDIVKYHPGYKGQVLELQKHLWNLDVKVNAAYLEWKYELNPFRPETPLIYLAVHDGEVVGMRGMYGSKWQTGRPPEILHALSSGDTVISPGHRNRGLLGELMKAALNDMAALGCTHVFSLSASPVVRLRSMTMGWRGVDDLQLMNRRVYHGIILHHLKTGLSFLRAAKKRHNFYSLDTNRGRRRRMVSPHVSVDKTPRPEAMAELVERTADSGLIRHVRDKRYFAWRYKNPLSLYRFLFWEESGLEGFLVLQTKRYKDYINVNMVDWEAADPRVRSGLLQTAIELGNFDKLVIWSTAISNEAKAVLENTGFNHATIQKGLGQDRPTFLIRPVREKPLETDWVFADRRLLDPANWDLRMIYSDSY